MSSATITSFLVKLASLCNLDCDYCYVYDHAEQSWRNMPKPLSDEHQRMFGKGPAEHARVQSLKRVSVIIHEGEPRLAGQDRIVAVARDLRQTVGSGVEIDVGL